MDPATAIGVASSAIAFLEFGAKLISATKTIYNSKDGLLPEQAAIEQHYKDVLDSSSNLHTKANDGASEDIYFQKLSSSFRHDCQAIVELLNAQRCRQGKRRYRLLGSIQAAFKLPGVRDKLCVIEARLDKTQQAMQLHVFQKLRQEVSGIHDTVLSFQSKEEMMAAETLIVTGVDDDQDPTSPSIDDLKKMMEQLSSMAETQELMRVEAVLTSLNYQNRQVRYDTIKDAHVKTFEWAFDADFRLSQWLRAGEGIFWVSGKPGSGKSTLMKFLASHAHTQSLLKQWAGENELVVASHYFWCSGTSMQKSWDGLLRSLTIDIFRSRPLVIQQVCPERWARAGAPGAASMQWTTNELVKVLRAVATLHESSSLRFCFFIDGLDEYDGDHLELCGVFKDLVRGGTIKLCLSSRPWPVFEDDLGQDLSRKLYVQDLTYGDIKRYVAEQLERHPKWKTNNLTEEERMNMVKTVTWKADGVFLWAYLVTRSLREGLSNYDTAIGLAKRLEQLPVDLKKLFRQILESVDPVYQSKMACFLQAALTEGNRHDIFSDAGIYCNMEKELDEPGYALHRPLVQCLPKAHDAYAEWLHRDDHLPLELRPQILQRYEQMQRIINSRTKGILEARVSRDSFWPPAVSFFHRHRTMYDFLRTKEIEEFLASKLSNDFNIHLCLMKGHLIRRKELPIQSCRSHSRLVELHSGLGYEISRVLAHAANALPTVKTDDSRAVFTILDEYERTLRHLGLQATSSEPSSKRLLINMRSGSHTHEPPSRRIYFDLASYFREWVVFIACSSTLGEYLEVKVKETPQYLEDLGTLPLYLTTLGRLHGDSWIRMGIAETSLTPRHNIVEQLLRTGADPNEPFVDQTSESYPQASIQFRISPWVFLMRTWIELFGFPLCLCTGGLLAYESHVALVIDCQAINLYLIYGANPDAEFWGRGSFNGSQCSQGCNALKNMRIFGLLLRESSTKQRLAAILDHTTFRKPPVSSISCFFAYIWLPFQLPLPREVHADYLATLDTFLIKHPSLDEFSHIRDDLISVTFDELGGIVLKGDDGPSKSPFVQFCAHICYQSTWIQKSALNHFRSAVVKKLIDYCGTINAHEKFFTLLEFGISKAEKCPEDIKRQLLDLVEKNRSRHRTESGSQTEDSGEGTKDA